MNAIVLIFILCFLSVFVSGCATTNSRYPTQQPPLSDSSFLKSKGIYHKVSKGETLWRIAKTYQVSLEDITIANNIPNAASIELNQLLFIPGVEAVKKVIPPSSIPPTSAGVIERDVDFIWPVQGGRVVSFFGDRKGAVQNQGIDIKVSQDTSVRASRSGKVVLVDRLVGYGIVIVLEHTEGLLSVYGHNQEVFVKLGDHIVKGALMGKAKSTKDQTYVHFAVRRGNKAQNPLHYLPRE